MLLKIRNLLAPPEIARLTALSRELRFVEGRASNPANETKDNLQADTHRSEEYRGIAAGQRSVCALARVHGLRDAQARGAAADEPLLAGHEVRRACGRGAHSAGALAPALGRLVHSLPERPRHLRRRRAVDRDRQPGDRIQGRTRRGDPVSLDHAARGHARAQRRAPGGDHVHRELHPRPASAHAGVRAERDRRARRHDDALGEPRAARRRAPEPDAHVVEVHNRSAGLAAQRG